MPVKQEDAKVKVNLDTTKADNQILNLDKQVTGLTQRAASAAKFVSSFSAIATPAVVTGAMRASRSDGRPALRAGPEGASDRVEKMRSFAMFSEGIKERPASERLFDAARAGIAGTAVVGAVVAEQAGFETPFRAITALAKMQAAAEAMKSGNRTVAGLMAVSAGADYFEHVLPQSQAFLGELFKGTDYGRGAETALDEWANPMSDMVTQMRANVTGALGGLKGAASMTYAKMRLGDSEPRYESVINDAYVNAQWKHDQELLEKKTSKGRALTLSRAWGKATRAYVLGF